MVYGSEGVCEIIDISKADIFGMEKNKLYYVLRPLKQKNSTIFTPVDSDKVIIRNVMSKEDVERLIKDIPNIGILSVENEKFREQIYRDCMISCENEKILSLIKTIYARKKERDSLGKKLKSVDARYLKMANQALELELSISLQVPINEMSEYITNKVNSLN